MQHIKIAAYHLVSNGLAERAVQTFKAGVKKMILGTLEGRISGFFVCIPNNTTHHHGSISSQTLDGTEIQDSPGL